jgi:riboflavin kinase/FMN adenylyltransferase
MNAVVVIDSNRSSSLSPPELGTYLRDMLGVADVLLEHRCHDSTFDAWSPVLRSTDVGVTEVARALHQREPITSTRIKACLSRGDVEEAGAMIDADVEFTGVVTRGAQLGRTLGFPTANLAHDPLFVWPSCGVYYGSVTTQGSGAFPAAINIGVRPTVEHAGRLLMEAHLLDFDGDLYDQNITVAFRQRLRDEQAFASLDALKAQLRLDVQSVARLSAHARR